MKASPTAELARRISDQKYRAAPESERTSKSFTLRMVPGTPPMKVLDVGCGTGLNAAVIAAKGHDVCGVDVSPVAVEQFRRRGYAGEVCDLNDGLPFPEGRFDLVFASEVIEHVADCERLVDEMYRVLRPGGRLVLSTPNSAFWVYRLFALLGTTVSELQHPGHLRYFSKRSLAALAGRSGFTSVGIAARHMYLIVGGALGDRMAPVLRRLGLHREYRFRTGAYFWHLSRMAGTASGWWADTLIMTALKPEN